VEGEFGGVREEEGVEELGEGCLGVADDVEVCEGEGKDGDWVGANDSE